MKRTFRSMSIYFLIAILIIYLAMRFRTDIEESKEINFSDFVVQLRENKIEKIGTEEFMVYGKYKNGSSFKSLIPRANESTFYDQYLKELVDAEKITYGGIQPKVTPFYVTMIPSLLLLGGMVVFWIVFMQQSQGGGGKVMNFGKSRAKIHEVESAKIIKFSDVAGMKEEKEELMEIVDFLRTPKKYIEIGARIPTGVLLVGPPGTGKTYLSKAVSGEANVPFFTISGSDFVEMFVGVGASRVRDLFEQAKKNSPCIVFIDEIDAVGRRRGAGLGGGHDEREQTLNQLLVEMDGFSDNEGIIVMAATNRADILDPAILRPGRFDRTIYVGLPDIRGREDILKIHTRNKPLAEDVDLRVVARRTPGFSPADLENLVNEAAILTARINLNEIPMKVINEASIKVVAGPEKKSKVVTEKERRLTAFHEAGHAVVSRLTPESDPVHMVTIIPRGRAGGFTAYIPEDDKDYMTKREMESELVGLLGGRVAEALVLDDISTGASNDIERATKIARAMVTHYGMSDALGTMTYGTDEEQVFVGRDFGRSRNYSEDVAASIDREMRRLIDEAYKKAEKLLSENMDRLNRVALALLEVETINGKQFEALFNGDPMPPPEPEDEKIEFNLKEAEKTADRLGDA